MYNLSSNSSVFQIDANFGTPSAMLEMLLYSRPGLIELLPAMPSAWSASGSVTGVPARGAFTVDIAWSAGRVTSATIHGTAGGYDDGEGRHVEPGGDHRRRRLDGGHAERPGQHDVQAGQPTQRQGDRRSRSLEERGHGADPVELSTTAPTSTGRSPRPATAFTMTNVASGLLVDVNGGSTADGAAIIQWSADGGTNQLWTMVDAGGGYTKLVSVRSGKVIGVRGDSTADNAAIVQQTDTGDISQHWQMIPV